MDIISASELNVCLTDLEKLFERIMLLKKILQTTNCIKQILLIKSRALIMNSLRFLKTMELKT